MHATRSILGVLVAAILAGSASANTWSLSDNSPLGENFLDAAVEPTAASVSADLLRDSSESWDRTAAECFVAPKAGVGIGEYRHVGGHHVHMKAAFQSHVSYDPAKGLSVSQDYMRSRGWNHQAMTSKQRELFNELASSGRANSLREHSRIAQEALVAGGASREAARKIVADSLRNLRAQGVRSPSGIPWNQ